MRLRFLFILLFAVPAQAAPMYRVVRVIDSSTVLVEHDSVQSQVKLAGIEITDPQHAADYLTWTVGSSWVMIENGLLYRSPDALFINGELVRRGYARAAAGSALGASRANAVYLGELDLGVREPARAKPPARSARAARPSPIRRRVIRPRSIRAPLR